MCLLAEVLPAEALLVGIPPLGVLLAAEKEMVLALSVFLEKREKILPEGDTGGGGGVATLWRFIFALVHLAPFLFS